MRILRLRLAGFGPYKSEQVVDFERFADDGIFLITGKTGAGKSSILDAVCYALYNSVPRFDKTEQRLRSDHCAPDDPSFVELEFSVGDQVYRVRRTPEYERPKQRGSGTTTAAATAELARRVGDEWEGMSARAVDVGHDIGRIVGLSKEQFLQVILLAQNRFQQFLRASNDDRQDVLRSLFGTVRFEQIEVLLGERRKALEARLAGSHEALAHLAAQAGTLLETEEIAQDVEWFEAGQIKLGVDLATAAAAVATTTARVQVAEVELARITDVRRRQDRRAEASIRLAKLTDAADAVELDRQGVAAAQRANIVWPHLATRERVDRELELARSAEDAARTAFDGTAGSSAELEAFVEDSTRLIGSLGDVIAEEARLPRVRSEIDDTERALAAIASRISDESATAVSLPARIEEASEQLTAARVVAAGETAARAELERASLRAAAVTDAARLTGELVEARRSEAAAGTAHAAAAVRLSELMQGRLDGYAGELATQLEPGQPCPVCGSTSHPVPATGASELITQDHIDDAHAALDRLTAQLDARTAERTRCDLTLADATARTEGRDSAAIDAELATAREAVAIAEAASLGLVSATAAIEDMREKLASASASLVALEGKRSELSVDLATATAAAAAIEARSADQRGDAQSVAERAEKLHRSVASARAVIAASAAVTERTTAAAEAAAVLDAQLAEQRFANAEAATDARRAPAVLEAMVSRIRKHDDELAGVRELLSESTELPTELADPTGAEETLALSRSARDKTLADESVLRDRVGALTKIVNDARQRLAASAGLADEYEQVRELAQAVAGNEPNTKRMRLETYVLAAQLEEIVAAANARLHTMTSGRFSLEHDDTVQYRNVRSGLGLAILDGHTGRTRATHSLSGGETFLASLALALGLAEVVTSQSGGITLDTLFIDEGFGSLDPDTLEIAMSTLDGLREGGRTIGLISHVDSMKEQLLAQLRITVGPHGDSTIVAEGEDPD